MGLTDDALQASIRRKNAVLQELDESHYGTELMELIFRGFDVDIKELEKIVNLGADDAMYRLGIETEERPPQYIIDALSDTVVNAFLTGLYHEFIRNGGEVSLDV